MDYIWFIARLMWTVDTHSTLNEYLKHSCRVNENKLDENASEVITGIILFFVIGCEFFINYKLEFRKKHSA